MCYVKDKACNQGNWVEQKSGIDEILKAFDVMHKKYGNDWMAIHKAALEWYKQFPESNPIYDNKHYSWMDERGIYFASDISGPNYGQYRYEVIHPVTHKAVKEPASGWRYPEQTLKERIAAGLVHFGSDETTIPCNKTYLLDTISQSLTSIKYKDGRVASKRLSALMGSEVFNNLKDCELLQLFIHAIGLKENDTILDFFAGSSSTAHAVMQAAVTLNRKLSYIMVQFPENLYNNLQLSTGNAKKVIDKAIEFCQRNERCRR